MSEQLICNCLVKYAYSVVKWIQIAYSFWLIDFALLCVCLVIVHSSHQNVQITKKWHMTGAV